MEGASRTEVLSIDRCDVLGIKHVSIEEPIHRVEEEQSDSGGVQHDDMLPLTDDDRAVYRNMV